MRRSPHEFLDSILAKVEIRVNKNTKKAAKDPYLDPLEGTLDGAQERLEAFYGRPLPPLDQCWRWTAAVGTTRGQRQPLVRYFGPVTVAYRATFFLLRMPHPQPDHPDNQELGYLRRTCPHQDCVNPYHRTLSYAASDLARTRHLARLQSRRRQLGERLRIVPRDLDRFLQEPPDRHAALLAAYALGRDREHLEVMFWLALDAVEPILRRLLQLPTEPGPGEAPLFRPDGYPTPAGRRRALALQRAVRADDLPALQPEPWDTDRVDPDAVDADLALDLELAPEPWD